MTNLFKKNIWSIPSVILEPTVEIVNWSVRAVTYHHSSDETHHLVGYIPKQEGRVTSAIQQFDSENKIITTRSGRLYTLIGQPGFSDDGEYVWESWKEVNNIKSEKIITDDYAAKIRKNIM